MVLDVKIILYKTLVPLGVANQTVINCYAIQLAGGYVGDNGNIKYFDSEESAQLYIDTVLTPEFVLLGHL